MFTKIFLPVLLSLCICVQSGGAEAPSCLNTLPELDQLRKSLGFIRAADDATGTFPRTLHYRHKKYDFRKNVFEEEKKRFTVPQKPVRIISHAVGTSEILWAICPRERIVAVNEAVADPRFSFIADEINTEKTRVFSTARTELVIGLQPDMVFTAFYSDEMLKTKLHQAGILTFEAGYFGDIDSIRQQITLIGAVIGEDSNARALVARIDEQIERLSRQIPQTDTPPRLLYYADGGYVPGEATTFTAICSLIGAVNAGTELGIVSWARVDHETLLKCDPDIIIVCKGSGLERTIMQSPVLSHAAAVKNNRIHPVAPVYLGASSQFILLTANILADIAYGHP